MKARLIIFDAETYRTFNPQIAAEIRQQALEKRPSSNTRKDLKDLWDTTEARDTRAAEALAKTAVDPMLAEPLCVAYMSIGAGEADQEQPVQLVDMMGVAVTDPLVAQAAGLRTLAQAWDELAGAETVWVGHNIIGFDLPLLYNAWLRNGIEPPTYFPEYTGKFWKGRVFDTMLRTPGKSDFVSLDSACAAMGVAASRECLWQGEVVDGSKVGAMYEAGARDAIAAYCMEDIAPVQRLYSRLTCGDRRNTYDHGGNLAEQLAEIRDAQGLSDAQRLVATYSVLEMSGLMRRAAA